MFKVKLLPHNRRVRDTLTINHNLSKRAGLLAGGDTVNFRSLHRCADDSSSAAWAACSRRSPPSSWARPGGFSCPPPCRRTTGRCPPSTGPSSPRRHTGPICGRPVSPTPLGSPTVKTSRRCWRWMVSHFSDLLPEYWVYAFERWRIGSLNRSRWIHFCIVVFVFYSKRSSSSHQASRKSPFQHLDN